MVVCSLVPLARLLTAEHRYAEAVEPAERAWRILQAQPHSSATDRATTLFVLGGVYAHAGRVSEGVDCAAQSVDLAQATWGPDDPRLGSFLASYADVLKRSGKRKQADAVHRQAMEVLARAARSGAGGYTISVDALR